MEVKTAKLKILKWFRLKRVAQNILQQLKKNIITVFIFKWSLTRKSNEQEKGLFLLIKPIFASEINSRCQIDLIDLQSPPDNEFNFILNHQDHLTKIF